MAVVPDAGRPAAVKQISSTGPLNAISRSTWANADPIPNRLNALGGVRQITIHHEGWKTVWFDDVGNTAARLELIRKSHINRMSAGDIGYHFIIDRSGRLWEGRPLQYQGAHVRNHNEHNVGIMVLGNFDFQDVSRPQVETLHRTVNTLMAGYRVPQSKVLTHQELNPTRCPGKSLQSVVSALRSRNAFNGQAGRTASG